MNIIGWYFHRKEKIRCQKLQDSFSSCGNKVIIREHCQFNHTANIRIGNNVLINRDCTFSGHGGIIIGNGCVFAHCVDVFSGEHNYDSDDLEYLPFDERFVCKTVEIGDYAWIGSHCVIMPGVTIGEGAIIGAGSIVTKDIPACAVACGNPAKVIKYRDKQKFQELKERDMSLVKHRR